MNETIENAFLRTIEIHPELKNSINEIFFKNMQEIVLENFTREANARESMKTISTDDMLEYGLNILIAEYNAALFYFNTTLMQYLSYNEKYTKLLTEYPYYAETVKLIQLVSEDTINSVAYFKSNMVDLYSLSLIIANYLNRDKHSRSFIKSKGIGSSNIDNIKMVDLFEKVKKDRTLFSNISQVEVNSYAINQCLHDILNGSALKNQRNEYALNGELYAIQDRGHKRKEQEDSVLILEHPANPKYKIIIVADGMGGSMYGQEASKKIVKDLSEWFLKLPLDYFFFGEELKILFCEKINAIDKDIAFSYNRERILSGSTLSGAIIAEKETILANIGDSRIYKVNQTGCYLVTKDESAVWALVANNPTEEQVEQLKFLRLSNQLKNCVGLGRGVEQAFVVPNDSYHRLILATDGVTDVLTEATIKWISTYANKDQVTTLLVNEALTNTKYRTEGEDQIFYGKINAGKDNATAAMYARR